MISYLVNKPNRVPETQRLIQNSTGPIHYKLPRSRIYLGMYYSAFTVGMLGVGYSMVSLIKGKPAAE